MSAGKDTFTKYCKAVNVQRGSSKLFMLPLFPSAVSPLSFPIGGEGCMCVCHDLSTGPPAC